MMEKPTRQQRREAARQAVSDMGQFQNFVGRQLADVCYTLEVYGEVLKMLGSTPEQFAEAEEVVRKRRLGIHRRSGESTYAANCTGGISPHVRQNVKRHQPPEQYHRSPAGSGGRIKNTAIEKS